MVWLTGTSSDALQDAISAFRRTPFGRSLIPYWSAIGVHRDAEFNRAHIPAFLAGEDPHKYLCVYPYVRSLEWYLLAGRGAPRDARRARHHGPRVPRRPREHGQLVRAGRLRVAARVRGRRPGRIVDVMRHLRGARARAHTREELPFLTGIRKPLADIAAAIG